MFNCPYKTPLDSVNSTNLWRVLDYMSIKIAQETLSYEYQEQAYKDSQKKRKK